MNVFPVLSLVTKVYETTDINKAIAMLNQGSWIIIAAAPQKDSYLFSLGFVGPTQ